MADSTSTNIFSNGVYDKLKFVAQILLPALATLYFALDTIWKIGYGAEVVGTITAIDTFLGVLLQLSTNKYYKTGANFDGDVVIEPEDGGNKATFVLDKRPEDVVDTPGKHSMELKFVRKGTDGQPR